MFKLSMTTLADRYVQGNGLTLHPAFITDVTSPKSLSPKYTCIFLGPKLGPVKAPVHANETLYLYRAPKTHEDANYCG